MSVDIATDVSKETYAAILESKDELYGMNVNIESHRVYNDSVYFAHIIGYIGNISSEEMDEYNKNLDDKNKYDMSDVVGKMGIEKQFESQLRGTTGSQKMYVDNMGKILEVIDSTDAVAGNDIYLTIDSDLQKYCYNALEQEISSILLSHLRNETFAVSDDDITIMDVYAALFDNNIISIDNLSAADASELERSVYQSFSTAKANILNQLDSILKVNHTPVNGLTDEYKDYMDEKNDAWDEICKDQVTKRYRELMVAAGMPADAVGDVTIDDVNDVDYYVLDRNTNVGYVCFESDSGIVDGVSRVFPVFFILVAVLVCMTTMNRMVEEQRSMIGMFKALGYGEATIMGKYMIYSGTAAVIGCVGGYLIGTYVFPEVIWYAYHLMYINIPLIRVVDWKLICIVLAASLLCTIGTTWLSCRYELAETAAGLMRPKAPKPGKRVLLERIPFIWKRMKFLKKVSVRNIFRYKKRFFMMIIGISGCTALLLTGFGLKDSITGFADTQFGEIQVADGTISFNTGNMTGDADTARLDELLGDYVEEYDIVSEMSWDLVEDSGMKSVNMIIMEDPAHISRYVKFKDHKGREIDYPGKGEAVINNALAEQYGIKTGDEITVRNSDMKEIRVKVSGIFNNHVYNYVFISPDTYEEQMGSAPEYKTVYFNLKDGIDAHQVAADLMEDSSILSVTVNKDMKERISNMMKSMNYIVIVVILSAGALAFIVLYNLTNINITERIREIATIKVLGFFKNETSAYVFRENRVLTAFGIVFGLILGVFLHRFVMSQIKVDMVSFDVYVAPLSYVYSIVLTFVFNFLVNLIMSAKLENINMAESLKSVE